MVVLTRVLLSLVLLLPLLLSAQVTGSMASSTPTQIQITSHSPGKCGGVGVSVQQDPALCNAYSPNPIVLVIGVNNTVVFHNLDDALHSATSMNNSKGASLWDTGPLNKGDVSSPITFSTPGRYPYFCEFHVNMVGLITVLQAPSSQTSSGGGIPEFPVQFPLAALLAALIVASYLLVRRRASG